MFTQTPAKLGTSVTEYIGIALSSLVTYATLTNAAYADITMKGFGFLVGPWWECYSMVSFFFALRTPRR
jgi:hypothetical protein